jgi:hypothetical protein
LLSRHDNTPHTSSSEFRFLKHKRWSVLDGLRFNEKGPAIRDVKITII